MLGMAAIYHGDRDLEQDIKFDSWIDRRKYRITTVKNLALERQRAMEDGIEVLIIKE
jgi:hypothetical protein